MKKRNVMVMAMVMAGISTMATANASAATLPKVWGDVNRDGKVTVKDAKAILDYAVEDMIGVDQHSNYDWVAGDVNGVGWIGSDDANLVLKRATEIMTKITPTRFPVEAGFEVADFIRPQINWQVWKDKARTVSLGYTKEELTVLEYVDVWTYKVWLGNAKKEAYVYITAMDEKYFKVSPM